MKRINALWRLSQRANSREMLNKSAKSGEGEVGKALESLAEATRYGSMTTIDEKAPRDFPMPLCLLYPSGFFVLSII